MEIYTSAVQDCQEIPLGHLQIYNLFLFILIFLGLDVFGMQIFFNFGTLFFFFFC